MGVPGLSCPFGLNYPSPRPDPHSELPGRATRAGGSKRMVRHLGQRWPRVLGNVDRVRPSQGSAPSGLSFCPDAGAGSPSRTPRVPCVRPWTALASPLPHSAVSTPGPHYPPPRAPRCRIPASLPPSLSLWFTTCGCGWFPGAATLLCRTLPAAGSPCDMPGAPRVRPPRRAASRRSGRAARRALHAGRCLPELSSHRHPRARTCRPPGPRPAPWASRSRCLCCRCASSRLHHPQSQPAVLHVPKSAPPPPSPNPPHFLLLPHVGVPNPTPVAAFRWGPQLFVEVTWWLRNLEETRSPPTGGDAGEGGCQGGAGQPVGSFGCSRGTQGEKHKWVVWGWWFLPGPITTSSCASAPPPPQRRGHSLGGRSPQRSVTRAPLSLLPQPLAPRPGGAVQGRGQSALLSPQRAVRATRAPGPF